MVKEKNSALEKRRREATERLAQRIRFAPEQLALLAQALTHPAYYEGQKHQGQDDNQRLEFLGDAVLDLVVGEYLYHRYPSAAEGELSKMRAVIVCEASLAQQAKTLAIGEALRLGRGSEAAGDRQRASVLADAFEAVIGAVYETSGLAAVQCLIKEQFAAKMDALQPDDYEDKKSMLQELVQRLLPHGVNYRLLSSSGPDHAPHFCSGVYCQGQMIGCGEGGSKKESEQAAARDALRKQQEWLPRLLADKADNRKES